MNQSNNRFKQVIIAADIYDGLKKLGRTGESFNHVSRRLLLKAKEVGKRESMSLEYEDNIILELERKRLKLRINSTLRKLAVRQILGYIDTRKSNFFVVMW